MVGRKRRRRDTRSERASRQVVGSGGVRSGAVTPRVEEQGRNGGAIRSRDAEVTGDLHGRALVACQTQRPGGSELGNGQLR